jgi:hypothetical protein
MASADYSVFKHSTAALGSLGEVSYTISVKEGFLRA